MTKIFCSSACSVKILCIHQNKNKIWTLLLCCGHLGILSIKKNLTLKDALKEYNKKQINAMVCIKFKYLKLKRTRF